MKINKNILKCKKFCSFSKDVTRLNKNVFVNFKRYKFEKPVIIDHMRNIDILHDPLLNKGTAFPYTERERFGLRGLVPPAFVPFDEQIKKLKLRLDSEPDKVKKYRMMQQLQDRNETLFYKFVISYIEEIAPIIYTPTVGEACKEFGSLWERPRGMYFSALDRGFMNTMVYNWPSDEVDIIVVTDGGRILGLGDLGCNGMGIPIGKLALYTAVGGIHPRKTLPVMLDVGTDNEALLRNPNYLGLKQKRLRGEEYDEIVDEFMQAAKHRWPNVVIQFEDFSPWQAPKILERYRRKYCCFNDDIQGTGAMTLGAVLAAIRSQNLSKQSNLQIENEQVMQTIRLQQSNNELLNQRIVCVGAGSAGIGVVQTIYRKMIHEGLSPKKAAEKFWFYDNLGVLTQGRPSYSDGQETFARGDIDPKMSLADLVKHVKPTIMLGLSGFGGAFSEDAIREMAKHVERPIIFPLSNPTSKSECTAEQAYTWTDGRAIVATGSPFDPVNYKGKTYYPSQGNNFFIYPGVGLGCILAGASRISMGFFGIASETLAQNVTEEEFSKGLVLPCVKRIREVSKNIAVAICKEAVAAGLATKPLPEKVSDIEKYVEEQMYIPYYSDMVRKFR